MKKTLTFFFFLHNLSYLQAQVFVNSDLEGTVIIGGHADLPWGWQNVPEYDPNCLASDWTEATPDITGASGPFAEGGIFGNPYSGTSFVSGLRTGGNYRGNYHEGIMQTVSGFSIGCNYTINLHQTVVKQNNALDTSGAWAVYVDNTLAGITASSVSHLAFDNPSLIWNFRSISFVATATTHTIKFLPTDDDLDQYSWTSLSGSLRMGIDSIYLTSGRLGFKKDTVLCQGQTYTVNKINPNSTYLWQNGSTAPSFNITQEGTYWVKVTTPCEIYVDTIVASYASLPMVSTSKDTAVCGGKAVYLKATGADSFLWSPSYGLSSTTGAIVTANSWSTTTFSVIGIDANGCSSMESVTIKINDPFATASSADVSILIGENTILNATGGIFYSWSPPTGLSCIDCSNPTAAPNETTTYGVTVTNEFGCTKTAFVTVEVKWDMFVPNVFSPNNDGNNDELKVFTTGIKEFYFVVYNRWGEEVFKTNDINQGWDGTYRGQTLNTGIFSYYIKTTRLDNKTIEKFGNVSLVR